MRRLIILLGLQGYAVLLALVQARGGVRTDEAKYLLDIPYPHPPLARTLFHTLEGWEYQEFFWRVVLATLLIQAVWLVWSASRTLSARDRLTACGMWLFSAPVILQAGSIMLAPLTALQGLVLVWLYLRRDIVIHRYAGWLSIFWGLSLFTAFQALLFAPLVVALYRRLRLPLWFQAFCIAGPFMLLLLFILGSPQTAAGFLLLRGDNAGQGILDRFGGVLMVLLTAGSLWGTVLGMVGLLRRGNSALLWTFGLLAAYVLVSYHEYYAVLFLPIIAVGMILLLRRWSPHPLIVLAPLLLGTVVLAGPHILSVPSNPARDVMQAIAARTMTGSILIAGNFGHQWQYESGLPIFRYRPKLLPGAQAVVCLTACPEVSETQQPPSRGAALWRKMEGMDVEVWVRQ